MPGKALDAKVLRSLRRKSSPHAQPRAGQEVPSRLVLSSADREEQYRFPPDGVVRIGRHPHNDIALQDALVSRWHATVWCDGEQCHVRDEGSVNGTLLNGRAVEGDCPMSCGDRLEIGGSVVFLLGADDPVPEVARAPVEQAPRYTPSPPDLGRNLDEFTLVQEVGRGGMSAVYMARAPQYREAVAIKVPNSEAARDPEIMQKFAQEAEIGQQLRHENIVRIYELRMASTPPYMVMEYVEGKQPGAPAG